MVDLKSTVQFDPWTYWYPCGIYCPRNPRVSPLYQCVRHHAVEFNDARLVRRPVEAAVLERFLAYGDWLERNLLAPVPHRQYVFALPKLIRPFFRFRRPYLGGLSCLGCRRRVPAFRHLSGVAAAVDGRHPAL